MVKDQQCGRSPLTEGLNIGWPHCLGGSMARKSFLVADEAKEVWQDSPINDHKSSNCVENISKLA